MCSSDSAFRVSGVLQLAKTGPPVTKNFPLLRLGSEYMSRAGPVSQAASVWAGPVVM